MKNEMIYLVEDEKFFSNVAVQLLNEAGYKNIIQFYSGESCLRNLYKNPDVIILDHMLGDMDGLDMLREIKSVNPDIDVIFLSAQENMQVAISSLKYGAFDYVTKSPECFDKLKDSLHKLLELKKMVKEEKSKSRIKERIKAVFGII